MSEKKHTPDDEKIDTAELSRLKSCESVMTDLLSLQDDPSLVALISRFDSVRRTFDKGNELLKQARKANQ